MRKAVKFGSCILLVLGVLPGCGGGGEESAPAEAPLSAGFLRLKGQIRGFIPEPVPAAVVRLDFGATSSWSTTTGSDGRFSLDARATDFAGIDPVMLTVIAPGHLPKMVPLGPLQAGMIFELRSPSLEYDSGDVFFPSGPRQIFRLGDNRFSGVANSQLQVAPIGSFMAFRLSKPWGEALGGSFVFIERAQIRFFGRGIESSACPGNEIGLRFYDTTGKIAAETVLQPGDSPGSGVFGQYDLRLNLPLSKMVEGGAIDFVARSGRCIFGDLDDYELAEIRISFEYD